MKTMPEIIQIPKDAPPEERLSKKISLGVAKSLIAQKLVEPHWEAKNLAAWFEPVVRQHLRSFKDEPVA